MNGTNIMFVGMLWFDNDRKSDLDTKVARAAEYYRKKYGKTPTLCFVHPSMLPAAGDADGKSGKPEGEEESLKAGGLTVRRMSTVLPNHLWLGVNGTNGSERKE